MALAASAKTNKNDLSIANTKERALPDTSAVVKANTKFNAIRTSIPASVRNALDIQSGDTLVWKLDHDGKSVFAKVTKKGDKKE